VAEYEAMEKIFGGRGGRGDWKAELGSRAMDLVPAVLERLGPPRQPIPQRPGAPAVRPAPVQQRPAQPPQRPAPAAAAPPVRPAAPAPAATGLHVVTDQEAAAEVAAENPSAATAQVEVLPPEAEAAREIYFNGVKIRVLQTVKAGGEFAGERIVDFLEIAWPEMVSYLESYSAETLTAFLQNDPILREAVAHTNWQTVLKEAQTYLHEDMQPEPVAN
jgi:hypothetical protein